MSCLLLSIISTNETSLFFLYLIMCAFASFYCRCAVSLFKRYSRAVFVRFSLGGSEFRLAMTDRATTAGIEVAKLVPWNSLLNY